MDHDKARELFSAYQDDELDATQKKQLEAHLAECAECAAEWELFRAAICGVSGLLKVSAPVDTVARVKQKIRRRSAGRFFGTEDATGTRFAVVSFTLILAFMLSYLLLQAVQEISIVELPTDDSAAIRDSETEPESDRR
jgi:anti-sigma factor RsiW